MDYLQRSLAARADGEKVWTFADGARFRQKIEHIIKKIVILPIVKQGRGIYR